MKWQWEDVVELVYVIVKSETRRRYQWAAVPASLLHMETKANIMNITLNIQATEFNSLYSGCVFCSRNLLFTILYKYIQNILYGTVL